MKPGPSQGPGSHLADKPGAPDLQPTCFTRPMYEPGMDGPANGFTIGVLITGL